MPVAETGKWTGQSDGRETRHTVGKGADRVAVDKNKERIQPDGSEHFGQSVVIHSWLEIIAKQPNTHTNKLSVFCRCVMAAH